MRAITTDLRIAEFYKVKNLLASEGISIGSTNGMSETVGFIGSNLTHGLVNQMERTVATGVCFPEKPSLQSIFPLLAVKDLMESDAIDKAYIGVPLFAYAGAGLARRKQYHEILGLMEKLYGERLGEDVIIIPDTDPSVMAMKYKIANLSAKFVSDTVAREKYPFGNLFGYFETSSYGADISLANLAAQKPVTIVSDFRQFESIHAGMKMGKAFDKNNGALLYTLINPQIVNGRIQEVSQHTDDPNDADQAEVAETSSLFYQAALLLPKDEVIDIYDQFRNGVVDRIDLAEKIDTVRQQLFVTSPMRKDRVREIEHQCVQKLENANAELDLQIHNRTNMDEITLRGGVVYERN